MFTSPHALIKTPNPVFHYQVRRAGRLSKLNNLRNFSRLIVAGGVIAAILWWGWLIHKEISDFQRSYYYYPGSTVSEGLSVSILILIMVGAGMSVVADVWYARTSSAYINAQVRAGQWDLVRLTPLRDDKILIGVYAVAQVQAWRMLMIEIALRIAPLVLIALEFAFPSRWLMSVLTGQQASYWQYAPLRSLSTDPTSTILALLAVGFGAIVYVLEPYWRMRAVVALGIAVSSRVQNEGTAAGVAVVALLAMRLIQAALLATLIFLILAFVTALAVNLPSPQPDYSFWSNVELIALAPSIIGTLYAFYRIVKAGAYRYALLRAFASE